MCHSRKCPGSFCLCGWCALYLKPSFLTCPPTHLSSFLTCPRYSGHPLCLLTRSINLTSSDALQNTALSLNHWLLPRVLDTLYLPCALGCRSLVDEYFIMFLSPSPFLGFQEECGGQNPKHSQPLLSQSATNLDNCSQRIWQMFLKSQVSCP